MKKIETSLPGVFIIEPDVYTDERGWFCESYNKEKIQELGIEINFIQDNHSYSAKKGTLRGIHFQLGKMSQTKLVRCTKGAVYDVAIDLRRESINFAKWVGVELSEQNKKQLFIPKGFGHAFLTLTDDCEFMYKVDNYYSKENDRSLLWNDKDINIDWPIKEPLLSDKDFYAKKLSTIGELL